MWRPWNIFDSKVCIWQQQWYIFPLRNWGNDSNAVAPLSDKIYGATGLSIVFPIAEKLFYSTLNSPNMIKIESKEGYSSHWICIATFSIARSNVMAVYLDPHFACFSY